MPRLTLSMPNNKTKATKPKGGGSKSEPAPARIIHIVYRSPITNEDKSVKFKVKQEADSVFCAAIADAICKEEGQERSMLKIWMADLEDFELKMGKVDFKKQAVKLTRDEKAKRSMALEWRAEVQINMSTFLPSMMTKQGQKRLLEALGVEEEDNEDNEDNDDDQDDEKAKKKKKVKEETKTTPPPKPRRQQGVRCVRHTYSMRTTCFGRSDYVRSTYSLRAKCHIFLTHAVRMPYVCCTC